jgi:ribonuclease T2
MVVRFNMNSASLCASILFLTWSLASGARTYCHPTNASCWPTADEFKNLVAQLNPDAPRICKYDEGQSPLPAAIPVYSPYNQPLYGLGAYGLKPAYETDQTQMKKEFCFAISGQERRAECLVSVRNNPLNKWDPAFTIFALNSSHIKTAMEFAAKHSLCINVAGTGHDFINRHSCPNGVMIRTTLMKGAAMNTKKDGIVFGAGTTCSEAEAYAASQGFVVSCGWAKTVGIAGWSLGGGHGPNAGWAGLGVDNIMEAEIITGRGDVIVANAQSNSDMFFALRGGGGSTWGVLASLTLRAHPLPSGGFTRVGRVIYGDMCDTGKAELANNIDAYLEWSSTLDKAYNGILFITPSQSTAAQCGGNWTMAFEYVFAGSFAESNATFQDIGKKLQGTLYQNSYMPFKNFHEAYEATPIEYIIPTAWSLPSSVSPGGVPSILVSQENVANGILAKQLKARLSDCVEIGVCSRQELYDDITGKSNSPRDSGVSISDGFRNARFHLVVGGWDAAKMKTYYDIGENSYFSESAFQMDGDSWKQRYWGKHYEKLLAVKNKYDPDSLFWCHHCVGDEEGKED